MLIDPPTGFGVAVETRISSGMPVILCRYFPILVTREINKVPRLMQCQRVTALKLVGGGGGVCGLRRASLVWEKEVIIYD